MVCVRGAGFHRCRRAALRGLLVGLLLAGTAPPPAGAEPTPEAATAEARAYLEAVRTEGTTTTWGRLQSQDVDPWILVEQLHLLGEAKAAAALAASPLTADSGALALYRTKPSPDALVRAGAVAEAAATLAAGDASAALARLPTAGEGALSVTGIRALLVRARALDRLRRGAEAAATWETAALRAEAVGWSRAEVEARLALLAGTDVSPLSEARHLTRLLDIDRDARDVARSASWAVRLGELKRAQGHVATARRYFLEGASLFESLARGAGLEPAHASRRALAWVSIAKIYRRGGNLAAALDAALRADVATEGQVTPLRRRVRVELASTYDRLRKHGEANRILAEALALDVGIPAEEDLFALMIRGDLARGLAVVGDETAAREAYAAVAASPLLRSNPHMRFVYRLHAAALATDLPGDRRTPAAVQQAVLDLLEIEKAIDDRVARDGAAKVPYAAEIRAHAQSMRARALNLLGRHEAAEAELRSAIETPYAAATPGILAYTRQELLRALRKQGKHEQAREVGTAMLDALQAQVHALPDELALTTLAAERMADFVSDYLAAAIQTDEPATIRASLERTRGMAFLNEVRRRRARRGNASASSGGWSLARLSDEVSHAARVYWKARDRNDLRARRKAADELWRARQRLRSMEERAALRAVVDDDPSSPKGKQPPRRSVLRADEAFLYFAPAGDEYIAVLHGSGRTHVYRLGQRDAIDASIRAVRDALDGVAAAKAARALTMLGAALVPAALREKLVPAAGGSDRIGHIYVSLGGLCSQVPVGVLLYDALRSAGVSEGSLPGVTRMPSQRVLGHVQEWAVGARQGPMILVGDPQYETVDGRRRQVAYFGGPLGRLEESRAEVTRIADEERGDHVLLGTDATIAEVRAALFGDYRFDVLHLSCHGLLFRDVPWLSALALHPSPGDDGLLTVDEIAGWRLGRGPGLIVLAACDSGLGTPIPCEGEEGLVRAFFLAGARHVVASLWKVPDDATRDLMIAFHRARRDRGLAPHAALVEAQKALRARAGVHPAAWAGWAVWGPRE